MTKAVWSEGVQAVDREELGQRNLNGFELFTAEAPDTLIVNSQELADLAVIDSNLDLCQKQSGTPILVRVNGNVALDPRDDIRPMTQV